VRLGGEQIEQETAVGKFGKRGRNIGIDSVFENAGRSEAVPIRVNR